MAERALMHDEFGGRIGEIESYKLKRYYEGRKNSGAGY
jgi:hypothetical protein